MQIPKAHPGLSTCIRTSGGGAPQSHFSRIPGGFFPTPSLGSAVAGMLPFKWQRWKKPYQRVALGEQVGESLGCRRKIGSLLRPEGAAPEQ